MKTFLFILLTFSTILFSQSGREIDDFVLSPSSDFYSNNYLNGSNTGKANSGIGSENDFSAVFLNPAAVKLKSKFTAFLQYSFKTNNRVTYTNAYGPNGYELKHKPNSFSGGFAVNINKYISAGLLYSNTNNVKYDFAANFASSNEFTYNLNIHSIALPVIVHFEKFGFGVNVHYNLYRNNITGVTTIIEPEVPHEVTNSFERLNVQVGLYYRPVKTFSAGLTFTPGFKSDIKSSDDNTISPYFKFVARYPYKISAGVNFLTLNNRLSLAFDYNFQRTSEMTGHLDKNDVNFGFEYFLNEKLTLRTGFFTSFDI
ncbi:MAG TPA: hypothetical protein PLU49_13835, partial [Saprospiraceae bacterium]|nr:hypothetical protein [Saprospiraceae bacterium]